MRKYFYNIITQKKREPFDIIIRPLLILMSLLYLSAIKARSLLYINGIFKSSRLSFPVISIGNITWGGTGKTPLAEAISSHLCSEGKKVTLLTRGYGSDEDRSMAKNLKGVKIITGSNRLSNALFQQQKGATDLFILDDGFQHFKIRRNVDIVTVNATEPFGNNHLIPAGILREPLSSFSRADMIVLTKCDLVSEARLAEIKAYIKKINYPADIFESVHEPELLYTRDGNTHPLEYLKGKTVSAVSGLGDNSSFITTLKNLGADVAAENSYMDHHQYTDDDLIAIHDTAKEKRIKTVVTTEKDWVKLKLALGASFAQIEFLVLKIRLRIKNEQDFYKRLHTLLSG